MLVVTGTMRSGTSLWMQMMQQAGYEPVGSAFPKTWRQYLEDHNPGGYFESELRRGIYHATNPHPRTGRYLHPGETKHLVTKVFVPGLVKSDHAFLDRVIGSVRDWREVVASLRKMRSHERRVYRWDEAEKVPYFLAPEVEWLRDNYLLIRDIVTRRYPALLVGHRALLAAPESTLEVAMDFLGEHAPTPDAARCSAVVNRKLHRNSSTQPPNIVFDRETIAQLDALVHAIEARKWKDQEILAGLNAVWDRASQRGWLSEKIRFDDVRITNAGTA